MTPTMLNAVLNSVIAQQDELVSKGVFAPGRSPGLECIIDEKTWGEIKSDYRAACIYPTDAVGYKIRGCDILIDPCTNRARVEVRAKP